MRVLKRLALAAVCFLATARTGADAGGTENGCAKDVVVYLDVSDSMYTERRRGGSTLQLFGVSIEALLRRENFVGHGDRIVVVAFAQEAAVVTDTHDADIAADAVESLLHDRTSPVGIRTRTNLDSVLSHIVGEQRADREQIFIIASDFAHDPDNVNCSDKDRRMIDFRAAAERQRRNLATGRVRLVLLTADVLDECERGENREVANTIRSVFRTVLGSRGEVPLSSSDVEMAGRLRRAIADAIQLDQSPPPATPHRVGFRVTNTNPFGVTVDRVHLSSSDGTRSQDIPITKILGCASSDIIEVDVPASLRQDRQLTVQVRANTPDPGRALTIPSERIVVNQPHVHVFQQLTDHTYALELHLDTTHPRQLKLVVDGVPGAKPQTFIADASNGSAEVAMVIRGTGAAPSNGITITPQDGRLWIRDATGLKEISNLKVNAAQNGGSRAPLFVQFLSLATVGGFLLSLLRGRVAALPPIWNKFRNTSEAFTFANALRDGLNTLGLGFAATPLFSYWGNIPLQATFGNVCWSIAAASAALFTFRFAVMLLLWRLVVEPVLLKTPKAIARRRWITLCGIAVSIATGVVVFLLLNGAVSGVRILHPVAAP